jgi:peptidoglycan/LPS O-acetylase OafA/YrhL
MTQPDIRALSPSPPNSEDENRIGDLSLPFTGPKASDCSSAGTEVAATKKPSRIAALDFTKGALVLIMVLYHWMNYFVAANGSVYKYLRFLTPSFIFISGFLISHVYLSKYAASGLRVPKRLLVRGLKLLAIVLCLNAALSTIGLKALETRVGDLAGGNTVLAYLTGRVPVAFSVLVPIAYLLIISAGLLIVSKYYGRVYHAVSIVCVACASLFELAGIESGYLQIFSIGMMGVSIGYIPIDRLNSFTERRMAILSGYVAYLCAITLCGDVYALQIIGVCLSLAIIYRIGAEGPNTRGIRKVIVLLGQYSLFGYIAQIVILQLLRKGLRPLGAGLQVSGGALLACATCTILSVRVLIRARSRISGVDKLYAAVFS